MKLDYVMNYEIEGMHQFDEVPFPKRARNLPAINLSPVIETIAHWDTRKMDKQTKRQE